MTDCTTAIWGGGSTVPTLHSIQQPYMWVEAQNPMMDLHVDSCKNGHTLRLKEKIEPECLKL